MSADHWMRFNIGDYLADTMHLTTLQHGIYVLLIMHYFKRGTLPQDDRSLARIAKVSAPVWKRTSLPVMSLFKTEDGVTHHRRIDLERAAAQRKNNGEKQHPNGGTRATGERARPELEPESESPPYPRTTGGCAGGALILIRGTVS